MGFFPGNLLFPAVDRKTKGNQGEEMATAYLQNKGIEILERNYRYRRGEIDIIGLIDNSLLVFYEVKYRSRNDFGHPETFVSESQQRLICKAAEDYIIGINWKGDVRFDIIAIDGPTGKVELLKDAFY